jgi:signal transduction histidine kinase
MKQSLGVVLRCDKAGAILEVLTDSLGLGEAAQPGQPFSRLAARGGLEKALSFLEAVRSQGAAFDWPINVVVEDSIKTIQFAGAYNGDKLLIIGAENSWQLIKLYEELMRINNEQTNALRAIFQNRRDDNLFDEISRLNNELVAAQRELAKKNAELERLNLEKNHFLGMAAHDLRNPLHNILMVSEFLKEEDPVILSENYDKFIDVIHDSSRFMANLVDDLLDVAKIEAGRLHLEYTTQDLPRLVERNIARNQALAAKKDLTIHLHTDPLPAVVIDASKFEQVLNNLLSNAIKFSPVGGNIQVRLEKEDPNFRLIIVDQGSGMTPDEQANLFKAFKHGRPGTQGEKSTGLGLVIVKRIIEGHGGAIWLESIPGQGTSFYVSIPLAPAQLPSEAN